METKNTFLLVADYYLVAHALAHGHTVVTHEIAQTSKKKIKIPDACIGLGIKCVTPYEMLRTERARFILGPKTFIGSSFPFNEERPLKGPKTVKLLKHKNLFI